MILIFIKNNVPQSCSTIFSYYSKFWWFCQVDKPKEGIFRITGKCYRGLLWFMFKEDSWLSNLKKNFRYFFLEMSEFFFYILVKLFTANLFWKLNALMAIKLQFSEVQQYRLWIEGKVFVGKVKNMNLRNENWTGLLRC